jgi:hypothetical protein
VSKNIFLTTARCPISAIKGHAPQFFGPAMFLEKAAVSGSRLDGRSCPKVEIQPVNYQMSAIGQLCALAIPGAPAGSSLMVSSTESASLALMPLNDSNATAGRQARYCAH